MEHVFNIAINVEDQKIIDTIMASSVKQIEKNIQQAVVDKLFSGWNRLHATLEDPLSSFARGIVEDFLESNKEAIIDSAARYLAEKLARTKAAKELVNRCGNIDKMVANVPLSDIIQAAAEVK